MEGAAGRPAALVGKLAHLPLQGRGGVGEGAVRVDGGGHVGAVGVGGDLAPPPDHGALAEILQHRGAVRDGVAALPGRGEVEVGRRARHAGGRRGAAAHHAIDPDDAVVGRLEDGADGVEGRRGTHRGELLQGDEAADAGRVPQGRRGHQVDGAGYPPAGRRDGDGGIGHQPTPPGASAPPPVSVGAVGSPPLPLPLPEELVAPVPVSADDDDDEVAAPTSPVFWAS